MYSDLFSASFLFVLIQLFIIGWQKTSDKTYQFPTWGEIRLNYFTWMVGTIVNHFIYKWW